MPLNHNLPIMWAITKAVFACKEKVTINEIDYLAFMYTMSIMLFSNTSTEASDWYFSCLLSLFSPFFILERERMRDKMNKEKGQCNRSFNLYKNISFNL